MLSPLYYGGSMIFFSKMLEKTSIKYLELLHLNSKNIAITQYKKSNTVKRVYSLLSYPVAMIMINKRK